MSDVVTEFKGEYHFLSNFYPCKIYWEGIEYPTLEHAFQAAKTFSMSERRKIAWLDTPGKAKRYGRKVELREDWEKVKLIVMKELLRIKFYAIKHLREKLIATHPFVLEEGNNWKDTFWGICPPESGNGKNMLGKLLMEVRSELINDQD